MATADINNITITGRLTRDIEIRATNSGVAIGNIGLAYSGVRKNQSTGEYEEVSNFIDCVLLGTRAEKLAKYLLKGTKVAISGELRYHAWEKDGQKRSKHEISIERIQFLSRSDEHQQYQPTGGTDPYASVYDDDYPF